MYTLQKFNHIDAKTVAEAATNLGKPKTAAIAGGTDILGAIRFRIFRADMYPDTLVNLKTIVPSLDYIKEEGGMLKVGPLTRLYDIATNTTVKTKYTALAQAAAATASPHIREMGTIGGNITQLVRCWYFRKLEDRFECIRKGGNVCYAVLGDNRYHSIFGAVQGCLAVNPSDTAPALVALNAKIVTSKKTIDVEKFWAVKIPGSTVLDADEIITEIQVPTPATGVKSAFIKFAERASIDFPVVNCAAAISSTDARICLNAVHNLPYRATAAETAIKGKAIDDASATAAGAAAVTGNVPLAMNAWKVQIAKTLVKRTVLACK